MSEQEGKLIAKRVKLKGDKGSTSVREIALPLNCTVAVNTRLGVSAPTSLCTSIKLRYSRREKHSYHIKKNLNYTYMYFLNVSYFFIRFYNERRKSGTSKLIRNVMYTLSQF